ncbi:SGT1 protein domain-containing protein [Phthorimaea operculella]|nr:SGT1 protein domain-containing protein [Phthorimaea operculella]
MDSSSALETLSEDTVHCVFFPTESSNADNLDELCESLNKTINKLSEGYIWHRDEFRVHVPLNADKIDLPVHLVSVTCFGDNIEDEWFIVYLLLEISKEYPNMVIQVYDNDGEFLLIEAADSLPPWANPDTTQNRVFIYQNHIHLIPANVVDMDTDLKVNEAIKVICDMPETTKSNEIQQAVIKRIGNYPQKITENIHRAIVDLPLDIAALLSLKPSLISPIVHAYCNHDVIDAKTCKNIKVEECVPTQVKFTKCLYAMLVHSKLIKTVTSSKIKENNKKAALGLKLTYGYEIIMKKLTGDVFASKEFNKFLKSLTQNGYFKGNMEGSRDYKQLLQNANDFFLTMECPINTQVCNNILQIKETEEFVNKRNAIKNNTSAESLSEDSDEWLNISPDQLNELLNSRYGRQTKFKSDDVINSQTVTSELSKFLKQTSDFEGIETHDENADDHIEFDSDLFVKSLKNMMNIISPGVNMDIDSDFDEDDDIEDAPLPEEDLDRELKDKLNIDGNLESQNNKQILLNMIQSMKEEGGATGPSSNILKSIGINKADILDSDDDIE